MRWQFMALCHGILCVCSHIAHASVLYGQYYVHMLLLSHFVLFADMLYGSHIIVHALGQHRVRTIYTVHAELEHVVQAVSYCTC